MDECQGSSLADTWVSYQRDSMNMLTGWRRRWNEIPEPAPVINATPGSSAMIFFPSANHREYTEDKVQITCDPGLYARAYVHMNYYLSDFTQHSLIRQSMAWSKNSCSKT